MNLGAWIQANKPAAAGIAGAGVVGLVLLTRGRGDAGGSSSPAGIVGGYSAGGQIDGATGGGTYDSSASDLYSALSGELGGIASSLQQLNERPATPVPAAPKPAAPTSGLKAGFYRKGATSPVYQVNANGTIDYLTHKEFSAITRGSKTPPKVQAISSDHSVWQNGSHWLDAHKKTTAAKPPIPTPTAVPAS